jgi:hypothetical protein
MANAIVQAVRCAHRDGPCEGPKYHHTGLVIKATEDAVALGAWAARCYYRGKVGFGSGAEA